MLQPSVERETSYYLDAGHWFLSLYNDDSDPRQVHSMPMVYSYYLDAGHWFLLLYNDDSDPRQVHSIP